MFGISTGEILLTLFLAAVLIRPKDMPHIARAAAGLWIKARGFLADMNRRVDGLADDFADVKKAARELPDDLGEQVKSIRRAMRRKTDFYDEIENKKTPRLDIGPKDGRK